MMTFNNFFTNGQADAGSAVVVSTVQPLKNFKNPRAVHGVEANAIICNRQVVVHMASLGGRVTNIRPRLLHSPNLDVRRLVFPGKFQRIAQQIAE